MDKSEIGLDEIKQHCRIEAEFQDDDSLLTAYAEAALEVCQKHIGKQFGDEMAFTPALKVGCLLLIGFWYESREAVSAGDKSNELPFTTKTLWNYYRDVGIY
ncbi:head-tail connector protein [Symbiopectobacterium sp. RP]|uniref:head-tail connector protein n=1 Tax=Symbiopectobacterium sp. RP TaxID=3248553 RepID=UPI003D2B1BE7